MGKASASQKYCVCGILVLLAIILPLVLLNRQKTCTKNPCKHDGTCAEGVDNEHRTCGCTSGWEGSDCGTRTAVCPSQPCSSWGTCKETNTANHRVCTCDAGYTGTNCDQIIDLCPATQADPCIMGTCSMPSANSYSCACDSGWSGTNCDICNVGLSGAICVVSTVVTGSCTSEPCVNGASCVEGAAAGERTCVCATGYEGTHCQTRTDYCGVKPCSNGGTCTEGTVPGQRVCTCGTGFQGDDCQIQTNTGSSTCAPNTCQIGLGDEETFIPRDGQGKILSTLTFPNSDNFQVTADIKITHITGTLSSFPVFSFTPHNAYPAGYILDYERCPSLVFRDVSPLNGILDKMFSVRYHIYNLIGNKVIGNSYYDIDTIGMQLNSYKTIRMVFNRTGGEIKMFSKDQGTADTTYALVSEEALSPTSPVTLEGTTEIADIGCKNAQYDLSIGSWVTYPNSNQQMTTDDNYPDIFIKNIEYCTLCST